MGLTSTSDFLLDTEIEILCRQAVQCLRFNFKNQLCFNSSNLKINKSPVTPCTRDGLGLSQTININFVMGTEVEILCFQAVQCLLFRLKIKPSFSSSNF